MTAAPACALQGRRVLELADEKGVYCGKLLADMGADVIKIEPPGGDATRQLPPFWEDKPGPDSSLFFLYMNTSKRGVTLDITRPAGQDVIRQLARTADIIVETFAADHLAALGLGYDALKQDNPRLVFTSITGFGQTGPQRHFASADIVASALGGAMYVTGAGEDPPVTLAASQAYAMASTYAAVSSMIALQHATQSGAGQHVDISVEETTASVTHICGAGKWLDDHMIPKRMGTGLFASVPSGAYPCKDGLVYLMVNRPLHWKALAQWISEETGNTAVLAPLFDGPSSNRYASRDLLDFYITELTSRHSVDEIYREGQRRHIAFTPVNSAAAVAADPHLAARDYFVEVTHPGRGTLKYPGAPYRHSVTPWRISRPAPRLGEHNEEIYSGELGLGADMIVACTTAASAAARMSASTPSPALRAGEGWGEGSSLATAGARTPQALSGVRVVELAAGMAGPWIGRMMAYCGAEVIKVESKQHPDVTRQYVPPSAPEMGIQSQLSPWLTDWNAGKRCVALDLTQAAAVELAKSLVATADIVVENYSVGVMDKLGLGYAQLREVKPDLIMLSSTGYGDSGPCRGFVTWGPNIEALSGLSTFSGFPARPCTVTQYAYPDAVSALHGLFAVLCALDYRTRTGEGQYINLSQFEATVAVTGPALMEYLGNHCEPQRRGNRSHHAAPHGCYRCTGDDRWCTIAVGDDVEWERFCKVVGAPAWTREPRFSTSSARLAHTEELDALVEGWTSQRDAYEVMSVLQAAGVAAGVVQNIEEQFHHDPQLASRHFFETIDHRRKGSAVANGVPLGLTRTPGCSAWAGTGVGEDNDYVFGELLGMTPAQMRPYIERGAIETDEGSH